MHTTHTTHTEAMLDRTARSVAALLLLLAALLLVPAGCHATRATTHPVPVPAVPAGCATVDGPVVAALLDAGHAMDYRPDGTWTMDGRTVGHAPAEDATFRACPTDPAALDAIRSAQP